MNKTTIKKTDKLVEDMLSQLQDAGFEHIVLYYDDGKKNGSTLLCGNMADILAGAGAIVSRALQHIVTMLETAPFSKYQSAIEATKAYKQVLDKKCDETIEALRKAVLDACDDEDDDDEDEDKEPLASGVIAINPRGKTSEQVAREMTKQIMKILKGTEED